MIRKWMLTDSEIIILNFDDEEDYEHFIKNNPKVAALVR